MWQHPPICELPKCPWVVSGQLGTRPFSGIIMQPYRVFYETVIEQLSKNVLVPKNDRLFGVLVAYPGQEFPHPMPVFSQTILAGTRGLLLLPDGGDRT